YVEQLSFDFAKGMKDEASPSVELGNYANNIPKIGDRLVRAPEVSGESDQIRSSGLSMTAAFPVLTSFAYKAVVPLEILLEVVRKNTDLRHTTIRICRRGWNDRGIGADDVAGEEELAFDLPDWPGRHCGCRPRPAGSSLATKPGAARERWHGIGPSR